VLFCVVKTYEEHVKASYCRIRFCTNLCPAAACANGGSAPADNKPTAANAAPAAQAPDDVMKKLSDLVHAGKYAEAQGLTTGLLLAYPDDQRLIKAKALLDKSLASSKPLDPAASSNPPVSNVVSDLPAASMRGEPLTGLDKVDYTALIELAREAQQNTDLEHERELLKQFMDQSSLFLQKHPDQMLLWQLRAACAISLSDPMAGYDAGQKLLAAGAADRSDLNLQQLLAQLKNKGWLDRQTAEKHAKYDWILGTWSVSWSVEWPGTGRKWQWVTLYDDSKKGNGLDERFSMSGSVIEGYNVSDSGVRAAEPDMKGTILDSGEIRWERLYSASGGGSYLISHYMADWGTSNPPKPGTKFYLSGYVPVISCAVGNDKGTMTMVIPSQDTSPSSKKPLSDTVTLLFKKIGSTL
jgi:hypothetical protein